MPRPVIQVENASVHLRVRGRGRAGTKGPRADGPRARVGGRIEAGLFGAHVVALDDVSLRINRGDRIGLIGHNGAGKTSLLRMLAGIYAPTHGTCVVRGRVSCLLNPGLGLAGEASLAENTRLALTLYGMPSKRISNGIEDVLDFAELASFRNMPLSACSAGMKARLGFGIATSLKPDVLLVDEVISAGDAAFAAKAQARLDEVIADSRVLILSAHSSGVLKRFCDKGIWMEGGRVAHFGRLHRTLRKYRDATEASGGPTELDDEDDAI